MSYLFFLKVYYHQILPKYSTYLSNFNIVPVQLSKQNIVVKAHYTLRTFCTGFQVFQSILCIFRFLHHFYTTYLGCKIMQKSENPKICAKKCVVCNRSQKTGLASLVVERSLCKVCPLQTQVGVSICQVFFMRYNIYIHIMHEPESYSTPFFEDKKQLLFSSLSKREKQPK